MVTIGPELIASVQHLRIDRNFERFHEYLRASLEDVKADLVEARPEAVQQLQGRAQALNDLLKLIATNPQAAHGVSF